MVTLEVRQLIFEQVVLLIATGFGLGSLPWVPGTFGSLLGIPLAWWLWGQALTRQLLVITALLAVGVPLCHWASRWLGGGDAAQIVADEYFAFPLVFLGVATTHRWWLLGAGFALYRLFDITKPPPLISSKPLVVAWVSFLMTCWPRYWLGSFCVGHKQFGDARSSSSKSPLPTVILGPVTPLLSETLHRPRCSRLQVDTSCAAF
ncbi:phosphatidylglycerophosphatase A [Stutzerimonas stutzeri]|jgi:phosphatidylglycerophosphatase A|uniref:phosphatidylglycerophosphatase A family protein n=1 Tax=Stutzerimonas stutzeri TaxID=316 RepID=UPI0021ADA32B|nr:phosphatidylglycerophosphatase A [Stutzerimonas stutzeri]